MKTFSQLIFAFSLIAILSFSACNKYGFVSLKYPTDPKAYFPEKVNHIAVVNRSLVKEIDKSKNILESIATAEVAGSDKISSDEALKAIFDMLNGWAGMSIIYPKEMHLYGTGNSTTPDLLNWSLVKEICKANNADALLVLETFDSNSDLAANVISNQVGAIINNQKPNTSVPSHIRVNVKYYFRLYDPETEKIIDQYSGIRFFEYESTIANLALAPTGALSNEAYNAGREYANRFLPGYYKVRRDMYKRGKGHNKQDFLAAFRKAEVANWNGAIEVWTRILNNAGRKSSGRACLNIAVAYEVLGDNKSALEWAKKAYEDYGDKIARNYVNAIKYRLSVEK